FVLVDAVLERDGGCARDPGHLARGVLGVPELDRDHRQVRRARLRRVLDHVDAQLEVAELAADAQAALAHRLRMGPAGDEGDVVARLLQARTVIPAHAPAAHHHDLHGRMLGSPPPPWQARKVRPRLLASAVIAALCLPVLDPGVQLFWRDTQRFFYPFKLILAQRLRQGELPLWDPWTEAGVSVL